jgi:hypothetical protein
LSELYFITKTILPLVLNKSSTEGTQLPFVKPGRT